MTGRHLIAVIAVLGSFALASGCGGGSDSGTAADSGTGSSSAAEERASAVEERAKVGVSKSEFIDQANALCAKDSAETQVQGKKIFHEVYSEPQAVAARRTVNGAILPGFEAELQDLKTLNVPKDGEADVVAFYAALEEMLEELKRNPEAHDFYPYTKAEKLAAKAGLTACGHP
jgi:hypothetical protein